MGVAAAPPPCHKNTLRGHLDAPAPIRSDAELKLCLCAKATHDLRRIYTIFTQDLHTIEVWVKKNHPALTLFSLEFPLNAGRPVREMHPNSNFQTKPILERFNLKVKPLQALTLTSYKRTIAVRAHHKGYCARSANLAWL